MEYLSNLWVIKHKLQSWPQVLSQLQCIHYEVLIPSRDLHQTGETLVRPVIVMLQIYRYLCTLRQCLCHLVQSLYRFYQCKRCVLKRLVLYRLKRYLKLLVF